MSNEPKPDSHAAPLEPAFLDHASLPLQLPRTVTKFHLSEHYDMSSWVTSDAVPDAIAETNKP